MEANVSTFPTENEADDEGGDVPAGHAPPPVAPQFQGPRVEMEEWQRELVQWGVLCPYHLDRFDRPRLLVPCGHSLCASCLQNLRGSSTGVPLRCPQCHEDVSSDRPNPLTDGLSSSQLAGVAMVLERGKYQEELSEGGSSPCEACLLRPGDRFCINCDMLWCEGCFICLHSRIRKFDTHRVRPHEVGTPRPLTCSEPTHAGKKLKFWCTDCRCLLCSRCRKSPFHDHHSCVPLTEASDLAANLALEQLEQARVRERELGTVEERSAGVLRETIQRERLVQAEIESTAAEFHRVVDRLRALALREVLGPDADSSEALEGRVGLLRACRLELCNLVHVGESVLQEPEGRTGYLLMVCQQLQGLLASDTLCRATMHPPPVPSVSFEPAAPPVTLGKVVTDRKLSEAPEFVLSPLPPCASPPAPASTWEPCVGGEDVTVDGFRITYKGKDKRQSWRLGHVLTKLENSCSIRILSIASKWLCMVVAPKTAKVGSGYCVPHRDMAIPHAPGMHFHADSSQNAWGWEKPKDGTHAYSGVKAGDVITVSVDFDDNTITFTNSRSGLMMSGKPQETMADGERSVVICTQADHSAAGVSWEFVPKGRDQTPTVVSPS